MNQSSFIVCVFLYELYNAFINMYVKSGIKLKLIIFAYNKWHFFSVSICRYIIMTWSICYNMICIAKEELVYNDFYFQRIRVNCDLMNAGLNWDICVAPPSTNTMLTMSFPMWRLRSTCSNWQDDNHYNMIIIYGFVAIVCIVFVYYIMYKTKR